MLPHLPAINRNASPSIPVRVPAPHRFRAPVGQITEVSLHHGKQKAEAGRTPAQRAGLAYEARVQRELHAQFDILYKRSPYVHFRDDSGSRTCVPDGVLVLAGRPVCIEIKSQHMPEAWWQLRRLYGPVLAQYFGSPILLLEICRSYDPHMPFNETPVLVDEIGSFVATALSGALGVLRWKL